MSMSFHTHHLSTSHFEYHIISISYNNSTNLIFYRFTCTYMHSIYPCKRDINSCPCRGTVSYNFVVPSISYIFLCNVLSMYHPYQYRLLIVYFTCTCCSHSHVYTIRVHWHWKKRPHIRAMPSVVYPAAHSMTI